MQTWIRLAISPRIVRRAIISAVVVGMILITINHGDAIIKGDISFDRLLKMGLTVIIPYIVSTVSSVSAIMSLTTHEIEKGR